MMTIPPHKKATEEAWTPTEIARDWRRRAELFWKLSKLFDDLAVRTRRCADWCDHQGAQWDAMVQEQTEQS